MNTDLTNSKANALSIRLCCLGGSLRQTMETVTTDTQPYSQPVYLPPPAEGSRCGAKYPWALKTSISEAEIQMLRSC